MFSQNSFVLRCRVPLWRYFFLLSFLPPSLPPFLPPSFPPQEEEKTQSPQTPLIYRLPLPFLPLLTTPAIHPSSLYLSSLPSSLPRNKPSLGKSKFSNMPYVQFILLGLSIDVLCPSRLFPSLVNISLKLYLFDFGSFHPRIYFPLSFLYSFPSSCLLPERRDVQLLLLGWR